MAMPVCKVDKVSILRIVRNLIDNALKYGGDTLRSIAIDYQDSRDYHIISVRDDGKGFDEKERKHICSLHSKQRFGRCGWDWAGISYCKRDSGKT
jgi:signal transduction histidine kinase